MFELLTANGLHDFYQLADRAGVRIRPAQADAFSFLDESPIRERIVNYTDENLTRVTFRLPAIHCIACVWLLENLYQLKPGIGASKVNFGRKEGAISFDTGRVKLSEVAQLLASLGYEPELNFSDLAGPGPKPVSRRLWMQLGFAGFAFGNVMLLSISSYLGLDTFTGPAFRKLAGWISFVLALPVFFYSAGDYWRTAWISLRRRILTIDVPIAAGIAAIFAQSVYEVWTGRGEGYFDSLSGLLFFLLCGKLFQQRTYARLSFDRDYRSFFPLSILRLAAGGPERIALSDLKVGDRVLVRHGELIPADATVLKGEALIDYSFVTGESEPVEKQAGEHLYAGGRQAGGQIEIEIVKAVSQGYLAALWSESGKSGRETLQDLTNRYSKRFTWIILGIALAAGAWWAPSNGARALKAFTSVLIVACPCALALAAPFTMGAAQRVLARRKVFVKDSATLERLADLDTIVFDKTGTLTSAAGGDVVFFGNPLAPKEALWIFSTASHSTHPQSIRIASWLGTAVVPLPTRSFREMTGCGVEAVVEGHEVWIGSSAWMRERGVELPPGEAAARLTHVAIDCRHRGSFQLTGSVRSEIKQLVRRLEPNYELQLVSGDNERDRSRFEEIFGGRHPLVFNQTPAQKQKRVEHLRAEGRKVMVVADGLNDAGALRASDAGVAVVENISSFSPASDVILTGGMVPRLGQILDFSRNTVRVVRWSFLISTLYNVIGLTIAARGELAPVVCAILMPASSATVVAFACGATAWFGRRIGKELS